MGTTRHKDPILIKNMRSVRKGLQVVLLSDTLRTCNMHILKQLQFCLSNETKYYIKTLFLFELQRTIIQLRSFHSRYFSGASHASTCNIVVNTKTTLFFQLIFLSLPTKSIQKLIGSQLLSIHSLPSNALFL